MKAYRSRAKVGIQANRFLLRPGVRALITLPEDLTEAEAKRLAKFVETLAVPDQRAITTGEVPAE